MVISKISQIFQKQYHYYRKFGFFKACKHVLMDVLYYNKFFIFEKDLNTKIPEEKAKIPVRIRLLSSDEYDIDRLVGLWPDILAPMISTPQSIKELIINRLSSGEECVIAEYEGQIIHMNWIGFQHSHVFEPYETKRGIGTDEVISYNIYCDSKYRSNNLMAAVVAEICKLYRGRGYIKSISYVQHNNYASIKVMKRFCGKPVKKVNWLHLFGFSFCFLSRST